MKLTRISDKKIQGLWSEELPSYFKETVFDPELELLAFGDDVAQTQLDDDQEKLVEIVQEIFKEIEEGMSVSSVGGRNLWINNNKWQALKQEILKEVGVR